MAAIITEPLKRKMLDHLFHEIETGIEYSLSADSDSKVAKYHIGLGKSREWPDNDDIALTPVSALREERNARFSLQAIKATTDVSYVVPRHNWTSGTTYDAYDDAVEGIGSNSFYVITEDNAVYMCLRQGKDATGASNTSTIKPSSISNPYAFKTSDGYVWKYLYTVSAARAAKFLSANYMPVAFVDSSYAGADIYLQEQMRFRKDHSTSGQITDISVIKGGTGFSSTPTVTITGDYGDSANDSSGAAGYMVSHQQVTATATVSGNSVVKIELDSATSDGIKLGRGYTRAGVTISGGGGANATARAIFSRDSGLGANPVKDLKATSIMVNAKPAGPEGTDFPIDQDFRQVALLRNVTDSQDAAIYTGTTGGASRWLALTGNNNLSNMTSASLKDKLITGANSGATAWCDWFDSTAGQPWDYPGPGGSRIYIHQNDSSGFTSFAHGENVSAAGFSAVALWGADSANDITITSGDILYIENRQPINRASSQTEDIKIVITL